MSKTAELVAKTDRDLASQIANALEIGLMLADNTADSDPAGVLHGRAADIYLSTVTLVQKVENVRDRRRLQGKLIQLRKALDREVRAQVAYQSAS